MDRLQDSASPPAIAAAARQHGAEAVAYTYNDPVIFAEYAIATAQACRAAGVRNVAVTAAYIHREPARQFFTVMDAANVDLKAFTEHFYRNLCGGRLAPILDTLAWIRHETGCWLEITTLLLPGHNDSPAEIAQLAGWIARELGPEVPLHFTAFHPAGKMTGLPPTPPATLRQARRIARDAGLHHVYTGNVRDREGGTTECPQCRAALIVRDGYDIPHYELTAEGRCRHCQTPLAGRFGPQLGRDGRAFGARRIPVKLAA
jgi:pyruvate formate lyase activating enzyme